MALRGMHRVTKRELAERSWRNSLPRCCASIDEVPECQYLERKVGKCRNPEHCQYKEVK